MILIKSKTNKKFTFNSVSKTLKNINYSIIIPVPVEENTGVDSRTEQFLGQINPDVIRRAPFEMYAFLEQANERVPSAEEIAKEGDINISEPGALIAFAGPRVVKDTAGKELPDGFQTSEFQLEKGFLDFVEKTNPDIIDINYGCPVKKVACKGAGAGILQDIPKMVKMTAEIVKT